MSINKTDLFKGSIFSFAISWSSGKQLANLLKARMLETYYKTNFSLFGSLKSFVKIDDIQKFYHFPIFIYQIQENSVKFYHQK